MTTVHLKSYKITAILVLTTSLVLFFVNYRLALGILLGFIFDFFYNTLMSNTLTSIINISGQNKFMITIQIILNLVMIVLPLGLAFIVPTMFHYMGVFIGLIINKFCFVFINIRG